MDARLEQLEKEVAERTAASSRLRELRRTLRELDRRSKDISARVRREVKDVDRLEGATFASAYHSILGDKPEALAKERGEALHARELHDRVRAQMFALDAEKRALLSRVKALEGVEDRLSEHCEGLERDLAARDPVLRTALDALRSREVGFHSRLTRLDTACAAADKAKSALDTVIEALSTANGWGQIDVLGGGLLTTAIKHQHIDRARSNLARAESALRELNRRLDDAGDEDTGSTSEASLEKTDARIGLDIGGCLSLADYFLDGFIVDWTVQSRIHAALDRMRAIAAHVKRIRAELTTRVKHTQRALADVRAERRAFVERES